jgi:hypothetical protein
LALALVGTAAQAGFAREAFNPDGVKIFPVEGVQFSGVIASFFDPTAPSHPTYKVKVDWGDGTTSDGSVTDTGKNHWDVNGQHTFAEEGTFNLHVTITGGSGGGTTSPTAQVSDAPLTATVSVAPVVEGGSPSGVIATFKDANSGAPLGDFTATIDWGDGTTTAGTIAKTGAGVFSVSGSHPYGEEGARTVTVTVKDVGGSTVTASQAITVADAPLTAGGTVTRRGVQGRPLAGAIGTFRDGFAGATAADYTGVTINWGDRATSPGTISPAPGGGWQVVGSHIYRQEGSYTITAAVNDRGGASVTLRGNALIADAPLRARGRRINGNLAFRGVVATFTDTAGRFSKLSDHRATINWGDGHSSRGTVVRGRGAGGFAVTGSHTYATAGVTRVTVSIRDRGGARATARTQLTVS